jgi:hypothetical protein
MSLLSVEQHFFHQIRLSDIHSSPTPHRPRANQIIRIRTYFDFFLCRLHISNRLRLITFPKISFLLWPGKYTGLHSSPSARYMGNSTGNKQTGRHCFSAWEIKYGSGALGGPSNRHLPSYSIPGDWFKPPHLNSSLYTHLARAYTSR